MPGFLFVISIPEKVTVYEEIGDSEEVVIVTGGSGKPPVSSKKEKEKPDKSDPPVTNIETKLSFLFEAPDDDGAGAPVLPKTGVEMTEIAVRDGGDDDGDKAEAASDGEGGGKAAEAASGKVDDKPAGSKEEEGAAADGGDGKPVIKTTAPLKPIGDAIKRRMSMHAEDEWVLVHDRRVESEPVEEVDVVDMVRKILLSCKIKNAVWSACLDGWMQITFPCVSGTETVLQSLAREGIGELFGNVSVVNVEVAKAPSIAKAEDEEQFSESIKERILMESAVRQTWAGSKFSFDFLMLLIVASILAGVGLATNNTVVIVASMLVSPLMGPILGVCFGTMIADWKMVRLGLVSEGWALLISVVVGWFCGLVFAPFGLDLSWPNNEMASRGQWVGLLIGLGVAIPSGVGVALSILGQNTNSLVGVAISASLLPPAVNAGLLWAYAMLGNAVLPAPEPSCVQNCNATLAAMQNVTAVMEAVPHVQGGEMYMLGLVSLLLALMNIACIYITSLVMMKIKEVAPIPGKTAFWATHLAHAREYNRTVGKRGGDKDLAAQARDIARQMGLERRSGLGMSGNFADLLSAEAPRRTESQMPSLSDVFGAPPPLSKSYDDTVGHTASTKSSAARWKTVRRRVRHERE